MTDGRNFFDQRVKNDTWIYKNIKKIVTTQGDNNTTDYLLDYPYYKKKYKLITIGLSKQQTFILIQKQQNKFILLEI